jgi:hypothetical protein
MEQRCGILVELHNFAIRAYVNYVWERQSGDMLWTLIQDVKKPLYSIVFIPVLCITHVPNYIICIYGALSYIGHKHEHMEQKRNKLNEESKIFGLEINIGKTKLMTVNNKK